MKRYYLIFIAVAAASAALVLSVMRPYPVTRSGHTLDAFRQITLPATREQIINSFGYSDGAIRTGGLGEAGTVDFYSLQDSTDITVGYNEKEQVTFVKHGSDFIVGK